MGDMNEDLFKENNVLKDHMFDRGFYQLVEQPTFDKGSLLDHIYVNAPMTERTVFIDQIPVYYSDHDIVSLYVSK